ncbi:MAG: transposase family protein [Legionellaceae bacterium]|nr:transposase family protein [Legionellaceae bacterium]
MTDIDVIARIDQFSDFRNSKKVIHPPPLSTILFTAVCVIFCGAEGWEDIVLWAGSHEEWLKKNIDLSHGLPSYSTYRRAFIVRTYPINRCRKSFGYAPN